MNMEYFSIYLDLWFLSPVFCSFLHIYPIHILLDLYLSTSIFSLGAIVRGIAFEI